MRFTNQFIATITMCILAAVLMVLVGAGISFYQMGIAYQQRQVDSVVRLVNEGWQSGAEQQDSIDRWLPALLDVNDIIEFAVQEQSTPLYRYQSDTPLSAEELSLEYWHELDAHPGLKVHLVLRPPFYEIDHSLAALSGSRLSKQYMYLQMT